MSSNKKLISFLLNILVFVVVIFVALWVTDTSFSTLWDGISRIWS